MISLYIGYVYLLMAYGYHEAQSVSHIDIHVYNIQPQYNHHSL